MHAYYPFETPPNLHADCGGSETRAWMQNALSVRRP